MVCQHLFDPGQTHIVINAVVHIGFGGNVDHDRQIAFFTSAEKVLHFGVVHIQIGGHLAHTLSTQLFIVVQQVNKIALGGVLVGSGVHIAEPEESVWMQDGQVFCLLIGQHRHLSLGRGDGQQNALFHTQLVIDFDQFVTGDHPPTVAFNLIWGEILGERSGMGVDIDGFDAFYIMHGSAS